MRAYSKGNKQKILLIAALMTRPDLLVLDEPTSGLDPLMEQAFRHSVAEARDAGQTVFLSSHILSEVEALARAGVRGLLSREPSLEELFLAQYGRPPCSSPSARWPASWPAPATPGQPRGPDATRHNRIWPCSAAPRAWPCA